jgi:hypothetical protein
MQSSQVKTSQKCEQQCFLLLCKPVAQKPVKFLARCVHIEMAGSRVGMAFTNLRDLCECLWYLENSLSFSGHGSKIGHRYLLRDCTRGRLLPVHYWGYNPTGGVCC